MTEYAPWRWHIECRNMLEPVIPILIIFSIICALVGWIINKSRNIYFRVPVSTFVRMANLHWTSHESYADLDSAAVRYITTKVTRICEVGKTTATHTWRLWNYSTCKSLQEYATFVEVIRMNEKYQHAACANIFCSFRFLLQTDMWNLMQREITKLFKR